VTKYSVVLHNNTRLVLQKPHAQTHQAQFQHGIPSSIPGKHLLWTGLQNQDRDQSKISSDYTPPRPVAPMTSRLNCEMRWKMCYFILFSVFRFTTSITAPPPLGLRPATGSSGACKGNFNTHQCHRGNHRVHFKTHNRYHHRMSTAGNGPIPIGTCTGP